MATLPAPLSFRWDCSPLLASSNRLASFTGRPCTLFHTLIFYSIFFVISFLAVLRATVATIQSRRESWPVRTAADEESAPLVQ